MRDNIQVLEKSGDFLIRHFIMVSKHSLYGKLFGTIQKIMFGATSTKRPPKKCQIFLFPFWGWLILPTIKNTVDLLFAYFFLYKTIFLFDCLEQFFINMHYKHIFFYNTRNVFHFFLCYYQLSDILLYCHPPSTLNNLSNKYRLIHSMGWRDMVVTQAPSQTDHALYINMPRFTLELSFRG